VAARRLLGRSNYKRKSRDGRIDSGACSEDVGKKIAAPPQELHLEKCNHYRRILASTGTELHPTSSSDRAMVRPVSCLLVKPNALMSPCQEAFKRGLPHSEWVAPQIVAIEATEAARETGIDDNQSKLEVGFIIGSKKDMACVFTPEGPGRRDDYDGTITKYGLDLGLTGGGVMVWAVFTDTLAGPGFLAGD
jgi:hypothetical protein